MKKFKKIGKIVLITLLSLVGLLFATPYLFKGKIVKLVKAEINKNVNARVDFKEVNISFFRHFPKVSIGLDELLVTGTGYFAADTLLSAARLDVSVDIMSFFRGDNMNVYGITIESARIHAINTKEGFANWDILKTEETNLANDTSGSPFNLKLQQYAIKNSFVKYDDYQSGMFAVIKNLEHTGSGDFAADLFTLKTSTTADEVTYIYGGIPFLAAVKTRLSTDIKMDNKNNVYSFDAMNILLNDLTLTGDGHVRSLVNGYGIDINFKSPSTDFKDILSLIPSIYKSDFNKVKADGKTNFDGFIKGNYSDSAMPGYHINMAVKDGAFKYADLSRSVQQVNFHLLVDNPDGETDHTVVDITNGHLLMDQDPFDFRLLVKNPISNMYVDGAVKGRLNLSEVANYIKLKNGTRIAGLLNADVAIKGNVKEIERQQYADFYAAGIVDVNKFSYVSADYPTGVKLNSLHADFTPSRINLSNIKGQYQQSNFEAAGQLNNLLSYLFSGKPLSANISVHADKVNLNDWMGVSSDSASSGTASAPFAVPANLNVVLNTRIDNMKYDNLEIRDLEGALMLEDEAVRLKDINGSALDGTININGSYSTKENKDKPAIAMSYNVNKVDIQKTFYAFNTAQKLMPIGKYLAGKLTSVLSANGKLGDNMSIDMSTISGNGNLFLIDGFLSKFAPLEKIASTLNVKELQQISLKDVKTFFEFSNGKLLIKPFSLKVKDIEMEIGGLQGIGFDEGINYAINLKLPRSLMGTQGNQFVDQLVNSVNAKGIPVKAGETVNLKLAMGGTIKAPTLQVDLKQSGETLAEQMQQQVKDFAQARVDSAKAAAKDTLNAVKKQLEDAAREELRKKLFGGKDTTRVSVDSGAVKNPQDQTKESVKGLLDNLLKKKKKDTANQQ